MKPAEVERLFSELEFTRDARRPPDEARRRQFRVGWEDATIRPASYGHTTLGRLTWCNLGYGFGQHEGPRSAETIDAVYRILEQAYVRLWVPRSEEDHLLQQYWRRVGGRLYVEVPIGGVGGSGHWPIGSTRRRLDAIRLMDAPDPSIVRFSSREFRARVETSPIELIEAKPSLNRAAIGQVVAGRDMFPRDYGVGVQRSVVVCGSTDAALEWVCRKHDIEVEVAGGAS